MSNGKPARGELNGLQLGACIMSCFGPAPAKLEIAAPEVQSQREVAIDIIRRGDTETYQCL